IRNIDCYSSFANGRFHDLTEVVQVTAPRVFGGKLNVLTERSGETYSFGCLLEHLLATPLEFVLKMDIGGCYKSMNAWFGGMVESFPGPANVQLGGASQGGYRNASNFLGYLPHRFKVAFRGNGEAGFDDVHTQRLELPRHLELFF